MTVVCKVLNLLPQISDYINFVFGVSQARGDAQESSVGADQSILGQIFCFWVIKNQKCNQVTCVETLEMG